MDEEHRKRMREDILRELNDQQQVMDEELCALIDRKVLEYGQEFFLPLKDQLELKGRLFDSFRRLGALQELVDDKKVTEIMVNGANDVFVERNGNMELWEKTFDSQEQLEDTIQQIVSSVNRTVNVSKPIADARLPDGSRVHVVLPPVALDGPVLTIRKFPEPITMRKLLKIGSLTEESAHFLRCIVEAGYNIFICGGTNSGKSTFLNALSAYIPKGERIITIEDSAELQITQVKNLVRLETRGANGEGEGEITIGDLIKASLRMNPDRIIIGEVRGKEALDMISAMNTGHDGSLSTGHGNSPKDMLSRLETMVLMAADIPLSAVRNQIGAALDILIHLGRLRDKSRRVLSIVEVAGYESGEIRLNPLYRFEEDYKNEDNSKTVQGSLKRVGTIENAQKLKAAGIEI
ncbi:CpaF family protein [Clostridium sp. HBUAS56010]|uniref:CpaF family protein n=1 Tax=Clostridium sp. HBUAS56010 TaxID=2571127 RepID=UPI001178AB38|nr:CpaF family protein [Clostridium sp. HBUAS56010]